MKTCAHIKSWTRMFMAALIRIASKVYPQKNIDKLVYCHITKCHSAVTDSCRFIHNSNCSGWNKKRYDCVEHAETVEGDKNGLGL